MSERFCKDRALVVDSGVCAQSINWVMPLDTIGISDQLLVRRHCDTALHPWQAPLNIRRLSILRLSFVPAREVAPSTLIPILILPPLRPARRRRPKRRLDASPRSEAFMTARTRRV